MAERTLRAGSFCNYASSITGIDISQDNVLLAKEYLEGVPNAELRILDVYNLCITEEFDVVLCLQNGLSAMKGQPEKLARLTWFHEQADKGLLSEIFCPLK